MSKNHFKTGLYTLCFFVRGEEVLLQKRIKPPNPGCLNGVGGKIQTLEEPSVCVIREAREECGLFAVSPVLKGILRFVEDDRDYLVFTYLCTKFSGEVLHSSEEGEHDWYPIADLSQLPCVDNIPVFFPELVKAQIPLEGVFHYEGDQVEFRLGVEGEILDSGKYPSGGMN